MSQWFAAAYPWIKALHIVSVISWMAGLLYLPRLFVYHADTPSGSGQSDTFKIMERRLLRGIMLPAMTLTYMAGACLLATPGLVDWSMGWIWAKLALVLVLTGFQLALGAWRRDFAMDRNPHPSRFFRMVNEVPTVAMVAIVIFVVVKPF